MTSVSLRSTRTSSDGDNDAPFSIEELRAVLVAARAIDRELRALARMKVVRVFLGSSMTLLDIESSDRKRKDSAQRQLNDVPAPPSLELKDLFDAMEQRAIEVAARNDKRADSEQPFQAPISPSPLKYALEPIDTANLALSRVQGYVTPVLTNADGTCRVLHLPPSAALVPPRNKHNTPTLVRGIRGTLTGRHGIRDEHVIIDDRASVPFALGETLKVGELVTCGDDLIQSGRPIIRYQVQKRIPECK